MFERREYPGRYMCYNLFMYLHCTSYDNTTNILGMQEILQENIISNLGWETLEKRRSRRKRRCITTE